jgi:hypothetical protein
VLTLADRQRPAVLANPVTTARIATRKATMITTLPAIASQLPRTELLRLMACRREVGRQRTEDESAQM